MEKKRKYQELTKLFLKRLIILEREFEEFQDKLKDDGLVRIYIETEIVPYNDMDNILELTEDDEGEKLFEDLTRIIEECKEEELNKNISEFIEKYI